jgi:hypothetical protein
LIAFPLITANGRSLPVCRYFRYEQREADIVVEALVRKTEVIRRQLGSAGHVI